jgi:phage terminase large subunit-like protein
MLTRIVIAVDPAISNSEGSDETGIIACGKDEHGHYYVLDDFSGRYSPDGWARKTVEMFHQLKADRIVIEVNQGLFV